MSAYPSVLASGAGNSSIVVVNLPVSPYWGVTPNYALGIICTISNGANLTYTVQITGDQVPSDQGNWNNHDTLVVRTSSANGNIAFPITGVRLNLSSWNSGSVNLAVVQWP